MDRNSLRTDALPALDVARMTQWLVETGLKGGRIDDLLSELCQRFNSSGLRIARATVATSTLNAMVRAYNYVWERNKNQISTTQFEHSDEVTEVWKQSPFSHMINNLMPRMRRQLVGPQAQLDFPVLAEFRDQGMTEWYGALFDFGFDTDHLMAGRIGLISAFVTDRPGGFSGTDIALLDAILPMAALAMKSIATYDLGRGLLATYLGSDPAQRVFVGQVQRGSVLSIEAVLFYADLRGFTELADSMPRAELVGMLDDYLEAMARPVEMRGGEILKFLGDGFLASFGLGGAAQADTCRTALDAAAEVQRDIALLNEQRIAIGQPIVSADLALHMGEVFYGNVGSPTRLDFTVIGPAVNEASRIELLCKELGHPVLVSSRFARAAHHCTGRLSSVGSHALRGVREETELFALIDMSPSI